MANKVVIFPDTNEFVDVPAARPVAVWVGGKKVLSGRLAEII